VIDKHHESSTIEVIEGSDRSNDRFYFSPDVGRLVWRGDFLYTEYGEVIPSNALVRLMPSAHEQFDNYADWSETYRTAIREAFQAEARKAEAVRAEERAQRELLVDRARHKLTDEEFQAVYAKGYEDGRS
jgi:Arc/MetJ-type ribon-helix-helix transcriptional regulator